MTRLFLFTCMIFAMVAIGKGKFWNEECLVTRGYTAGYCTIVFWNPWNPMRIWQ